MKLQHLMASLAVISLLVSSSLLTHAVAGQPETPKHEFRSSWLTTAWALDWPTGLGVSNDQQQMINILDQLESRNMNAVVFQASSRGDAFYQSERLPWSYALTGTPGQDPGWDPLQFVIDEARKRGLEVHAWFNAFTTAYDSHNDAPADADIPNVRFTNPEWMESGGWMNPAYPDAREWHVQNVLEMVENYDLDAVHFDRIRYQSGGYASDASLMDQYNPEDISDLDDWRRYNVTEFMRLVHEGIQEIKPHVKVGVTPVGHYNAASTNGWAALYGATSAFQDSRYWAEKGYIDYVAPQLYWDIGNNNDPPEFEYIANDWVQKRRNDRHIYIGIGAHHNHIRNEIGAQIDTTRSVGTEGQLYFRHTHVANSSFVGRYDSKALVPPMPWRNMTQPNKVRELAWDVVDDKVKLTWEEPRPGRGEGDPFFRYVIYRTDAVEVINDRGIIDDPDNIVALTGDTSFENNLPEDENGSESSWYVTALSRNNVESDHEKVEIITVSAEEIRPVASSYSLEQNYPNPFNPATKISFSLPEQTHVSLEIFDVTGRSVVKLLDKELSSGSHTVEWDATGFASGIYLYRLQTPGFRKTRSMTLIK